jgi:hypothetical protein
MKLAAHAGPPHTLHLNVRTEPPPGPLDSDGLLLGSSRTASACPLDSDGLLKENELLPPLAS